MNITIDTNKDVFFRQLLDLLSSFKPIRGLRKGEIDVLAEIMSQHYKYKSIKEDYLRRNIIFNPDNKQVICDKLNISRSTFNNIIHSLRTKGILDSNNKLTRALNILPDDKFEFTVIFNIKENE